MFGPKSENVEHTGYFSAIELEICISTKTNDSVHYMTHGTVLLCENIIEIIASVAPLPIKSSWTNPFLNLKGDDTSMRSQLVSAAPYRPRGLNYDEEIKKRNWMKFLLETYGIFFLKNAGRRVSYWQGVMFSASQRICEWMCCWIWERESHTVTISSFTHPNDCV